MTMTIHKCTPLLYGIDFFAFAVYMVPGLWGAPLKAVSAFAPPMTTQDFNLYNNEVHANLMIMMPAWNMPNAMENRLCSTSQATDV